MDHSSSQAGRDDGHASHFVQEPNYQDCAAAKSPARATLPTDVLTFNFLQVLPRSSDAGVNPNVTPETGQSPIEVYGAYFAFRKV